MCCNVFKIILLTVLMDSMVFKRMLLTGFMEGVLVLAVEDGTGLTTVWKETVRRLSPEEGEGFFGTALLPLASPLVDKRTVGLFSNGPSGMMEKPDGSRRKSAGSSPLSTRVKVDTSTGMYTNRDPDSSVLLS